MGVGPKAISYLDDAVLSLTLPYLDDVRDGRFVRDLANGRFDLVAHDAIHLFGDVRLRVQDVGSCRVEVSKIGADFFEAC